MRFSMKALLFSAIAVGLVMAALSTPAMALITDDYDTRPLISGPATDIDSGIVNGRAVGITSGDSPSPGALFVGYYRTNGTRTSAKDRGTQDTTPMQDTVLGVPAGNLRVRMIEDADSKVRRLNTGGFIGWAIDDPAGAALLAYSGETYPRRVPPGSGDTQADADSVPWILIELEDTGVAMIQVINTSNYPCTFTVMIHMPDTDFRVHRSRAGDYKEKDSDMIRKFVTSVASDSRSSARTGVGNKSGEITAATHVPFSCTIPVIVSATGVVLAEDAETYIYLRVAAASQAFARDSLPITIVLFPDTSPDTSWGNLKRNKVRIYHDSGYLGDNDTIYAQGGSEDSVSVFVLVSTAILRAKKTDSIFAPWGYLQALGIDNRYGSNRSSDTVPGATIVYSITYDNDGNRRADSVEIIDYLPATVDLLIDTYWNGMDTYFNGVGVDTRLGHARASITNGANMAAAEDVFARVSYSYRLSGDSLTFVTQTLPLTLPFERNVADSIAAIKISWPTSDPLLYSVQRDQVDDDYRTSTSDDDGLFTVDGCNLNLGRVAVEGIANTDSGDCGRITFAVVIR